MSSQCPAISGCEPCTTELSEGLRYFARQPILDLHGNVCAYELLFRSGPELAFRGDGDVATRTVLDNAVMFGLEKLTDGLPAFVNCTLDALARHLVDVLPPERTVLEVLETLDPTPQLISHCRRLKALGYKLALDDFQWKNGIEPLVELADYIKVDIVQSGFAERNRLLRRLQSYPVTLLAEKVETREENEQLRAEGFTLFQGYYFCRPKLLRKREVAANKIAQLELLVALQQGPIDLGYVSHLVQRDPAIAYRLLRLANSPASGLRQEVHSLESALILIGEQMFRRMAALAITDSLNGKKSTEVLRIALVRARFCELAARRTRLDPTEQYLLGLFSMLPAMLQVSMEEAIAALPLRPPIRDALLGARTGDRCLLCWMESNEIGDWAHCEMIADQKKLDRLELMTFVFDAMQWTDEALRSV